MAKRQLTTEEFIEKAIKIHGNKYDYSKVNYAGTEEKVCIICPKHGEFWQRPCDHLSGYGCPKCRSLRSSTEDFIKKATSVHGDKYCYDYVKYNGCRNEVKILCKKHGIFYQKPFKHLQGHGCPRCNSSHLEEKVSDILKSKKINFEYQCGKKTFIWLGLQTLDFYLPDYNIAIECQGEQHYEPIDFAGKGKEWAEKLLIENIKRDNIKKEKCKENKVEILYVNKNNFENVINKWLGVNSLI